MKAIKKSFLSVGLLAFALAGAANASTVNIAANVNAPPDVVFALVTASTTGANMAALGLFVVIHFSNGTDSGPVVWTTNVGGCTSAGGCGQATGAAGNGTWLITETGNTGAVGDIFNPDTSAVNPWTLTNTSTNLAITSVDLLGGNFVTFDRDTPSPGATPLSPSGGQTGTPNSAGGIDYTFASESGGTFTVGVTYSSIVQLAGPAVTCQGSFFSGNTTATGCTDEWNKVTFAFTAGTFQNTGSGTALWSFFQDTDQVGVPEPLTLGLMGAGLLGLTVYRKRRNAALSN